MANPKNRAIAALRKKKRANYLKEYRRQHRTALIPLGSTIKCLECGIKIIKKGGRQKYCTSCRADVVRTWDREHWRAKQHRDIAIIGETISCVKCGKKIIREGACQKFCAECKELRKTERAREGSERHRRKIGIKRIKGTKIICQRCKTAFVRNGVNRKFCDVCGPIVNLERANIRAEQVRRERGCIAVGTEKSCQSCKRRFYTDGKGGQVYCSDCRILQKKGKLPTDKVRRNRYWKTVLQPKYYADAKFRAHIKRQMAESRKRRKLDPAFTINERMSAGIRQSLVNGKNGYHWESLVNYTLAELMRHLERQFVKGMTWANRGQWHIDHIVPINSFKFLTVDDPEFRACWSLSNLRPLWGKENNHKRATRTFLL